MFRVGDYRAMKINTPPTVIWTIQIAHANELGDCGTFWRKKVQTTWKWTIFDFSFQNLESAQVWEMESWMDGRLCVDALNHGWRQTTFRINLVVQNVTSLSWTNPSGAENWPTAGCAAHPRVSTNTQRQLRYETGTWGGEGKKKTILFLDTSTTQSQPSSTQKSLIPLCTLPLLDLPG